MSCPECSRNFREYLIFRKAVARFAKQLDDLEQERLRWLQTNRPEGLPPIVSFKAIMLDDIEPSEPGQSREPTTQPRA